jgi:hypothetical protein
VQIDTRSTQLFLANPTADSTTAGTSIANPAAQMNSPGGLPGAINMGAGGDMSSNGLLILPFGVGSAGNTFLMSAFAWDEVRGNNPNAIPGGVSLWVAWILASFTCTLNTNTGQAGTDVDNTHNFVGTIVLGVGNANISNEIISPTGNVNASILLDTKGAKYVQLLFAMNGSSTAANALVRRM